MTSYTGFDRDLVARDRVILVPVNVGDGDDAFSASCMTAFDDALADCKAKGIIVRAVVRPPCARSGAVGREAHGRSCAIHRTR